VTPRRGSPSVVSDVSDEEEEDEEWLRIRWWWCLDPQLAKEQRTLDFRSRVSALERNDERAKHTRIYTRWNALVPAQARYAHRNNNKGWFKF
jgi:hypothetical protein